MNIERLANCASRAEVLDSILDEVRPKSVLEIGVWRGNFSVLALKKAYVERFWMLDPWRNLDDWAKPFNVSDEEFNRVFETAMQRTNFAKQYG